MQTARTIPAALMLLSALVLAGGHGAHPAYAGSGADCCCDPGHVPPPNAQPAADSNCPSGCEQGATCNANDTTADYWDARCVRPPSGGNISCALKKRTVTLTKFKCTIAATSVAECPDGYSKCQWVALPLIGEDVEIMECRPGTTECDGMDHLPDC